MENVHSKQQNYYTSSSLTVMKEEFHETVRELDTSAAELNHWLGSVAECFIMHTCIIGIAVR